MTSFMENLPDEIIELILSEKSLNCKEIYRFGCCCKRFNHLAKDENLWRRKANQRWKFWNKKFQLCETLCWPDVYRKRHQVEIFIKNQLSTLQEESCLQSMISETEFGFLNTYLNMAEEDSYLYVNDTIQSMLHETDCSKNLTLKYYAKKASISLTRLMCKKDLHAYLENPERTECLEEGATLIARWMCPMSDISMEDINHKLEDIANMVKAKLGMKEEQNIANVSDKSIQLKAIYSLNDVLYKQLKFQGNKEDYYNLSNSYINEVLETKLGIPISLSVLFQSIAKRIGLPIEPVNCPGHFLVRWKYLDSSVNEIRYRHIDCFDEGAFLDQKELPHSLSPGPVPPPRKILERMMLNIIYILQVEVEKTQLHESIQTLSHALDLFLILVPDHMEMTRLNARIKLYLCVQLEEVIKSMESLLTKQLTHHLEDERLLKLAKERNQSLAGKKRTPKPKLRSDPDNAKVCLKVGTIMHHRRFDYRCVVYGWDPACRMSEEWIAQMGVDNLLNGRNQPFYNVLVSDGTERYASQESLCPEPQIQMITHPEVGRYFREFTGDWYIPNDQLRKVYPEDSPM